MATMNNPADADLDLNGHRTRNTAPSLDDADYLRRDELETVFNVRNDARYLLRSGGNTLTGDIPAAGHTFTSLRDAAAAGEPMTLGQFNAVFGSLSSLLQRITALEAHFPAFKVLRLVGDKSGDGVVDLGFGGIVGPYNPMNVYGVQYRLEGDGTDNFEIIRSGGGVAGQFGEVYRDVIVRVKRNIYAQTSTAPLIALPPPVTQGAGTDLLNSPINGSNGTGQPVDGAGRLPDGSTYRTWYYLEL